MLFHPQVAAESSATAVSLRETGSAVSAKKEVGVIDGVVREGAIVYERRAVARK